jgi:transcriptional regulator with XRE-family HTH domain
MDEVRQLQVSLGQVIRDRRKRMGHSQESFADAAGVHKNYMGSVERGERNVSLRNLKLIAKALGLPLTMLIALAEADTLGDESDRRA